MEAPVLSACYFGPVELYRLLARHERVLFDAGEHYVRQSYRTRTRIVGPNGPQDLCVHVQHDHGAKMPMREVRLSYAETWPQQHLHAIRSAYGNSPWFIHYIDDIEAVLLARHEHLVDLDLATLRLGMRWLGLRTGIDVSRSYVETDAPGRLDLRASLHPKRPLPAGMDAGPAYAQVFELRHGFQPRLSVLDLVMNQGPEAAAWLRRS